MTRRMIVCISTIIGLVALVVSATAASAQVGLPFTFDFAALFQSILNSLPEFMRAALAEIFTAILNGFCALFGTCSS